MKIERESSGRNFTAAFETRKTPPAGFVFGALWSLRFLGKGSWQSISSREGRHGGGVLVPGAGASGALALAGCAWPPNEQQQRRHAGPGGEDHKECQDAYVEAMKAVKPELGESAAKFIYKTPSKTSDHPGDLTARSRMTRGEDAEMLACR